MRHTKLLLAAAVMFVVAGGTARWSFARAVSPDEVGEYCSKCFWSKFSSGTTTHVWWERCDDETQEELTLEGERSTGPADVTEGVASPPDYRASTGDEEIDHGWLCAKCFLSSPEYQECRPPGGDGTPSFQGACPEGCWGGGALEMQAVARNVIEASSRGDAATISRLLTENMGNVVFLKAAGAIEVRTCEGRLVERVAVSPQMSSAILSAH